MQLQPRNLHAECVCVFVSTCVARTHTHTHLHTINIQLTLHSVCGLRLPRLDNVACTQTRVDSSSSLSACEDSCTHTHSVQTAHAHSSMHGTDKYTDAAHTLYSVSQFITGMQMCKTSWLYPSNPCKCFQST